MDLRIWLMALGVCVMAVLAYTGVIPEYIKNSRAPEASPPIFSQTVSATPVKQELMRAAPAAAPEPRPVVETLDAPPPEEVMTPEVMEEPELTPSTTPEETPMPVIFMESGSVQYVEVHDGCGPYYNGACLNLRSGPGTEFPSVGKLRNGMVLRTDGTVEKDGMTWYRIIFDEWIRYPERVSGERYVAGEFVRPFFDPGPQELASGEEPTTEKRIVIERGTQTLTAYDGTEVFMEEHISTGLALTPTPRGIFTIFRKTPSRYMQGPLPGVSDDEYDLPGVPWNLYFTAEGAAIHGTYWHDKFGRQWSHGCVNLPPDKAHELYQWADIGTQVTVRD